MVADEKLGFTLPRRSMAVMKASVGTKEDNSEVVKKAKKDSRAITEGRVVSIGLSHHTATVEVREKLSIPEAQWVEAAAELCELPNVAEAAVLSTCNRFEVYLVCYDVYGGIREVTEYLSKRSGVSVKDLRPFLFMLCEEEAVWHLLRVSAGLDSLVVGEGQILSQVKKCYELATEKEGSAGKILNRLLNAAVSAGKRVRSETGIAKGAVSISSAAVELAELKAVDDLNMPLMESRISIIGAGKMSRLLVQHLTSRGVGEIVIVNRSMERAQELAAMFPDHKLVLRTLDSMMETIRDSDIVFTSTGSAEPILFADNMAPILQGRGPCMLVDISVPRNVAADVSTVENAVSYNVDDLKAVVAKNQQRRQKLILEAQELLKGEQTQFNNWLHSLGCVPAINKLQDFAEQIRQDELQRVMKKLNNLSAAEMEAVERLSKGIINKMLHGPMTHLRGLSDMEERAQTLKNLESLFKL